MEYNGGAIVAMAGENCVGIAADTRHGLRQLMTVGCNRQKIFQLTDQTFVGLAGLATDVQTMSQLLDFRTKLYSLREERTMQPHIVGNMLSSMLYEKRFGPWFTEPVVAGLDKEHGRLGARIARSLHVVSFLAPLASQQPRAPGPLASN